MTRRSSWIALLIAGASVFGGLAWYFASPIGTPTQFAAHATGSCALSGRILSAQKAGVSRATVCAIPVSISGTVSSCVESQADGRYAFTTLAPRDYHLSASAPGFGADEAKEPVRLSACGSIANVDIILAAKGAQLAGNVRDNAGHVVRDAQVTISGPGEPFSFSIGAQSDSGGRFATYVPAGQVRLEVKAHGYATAQIFTVAPNADLQIVLIPGATLAGKVLALSDKQPVADIDVHAVSPRAGTRELAPSILSNGVGEFVIEGLSPGVYQLEGVNAHWRGHTQAINVGMGEHIDNLIVEVNSGVQVHAQIVISEGRIPCKTGFAVLYDAEKRQNETRLREAMHSPDPKSEIEKIQSALTKQSFLPTLTSIVDARGYVSFDGVPPGHFGADVQCYEYRRKDEPINFEVADRDIDDLEWTVQSATRVTISVEDESGRPISGANVGLFTEQRAYMPGVERGPGKYVVIAVPAGEYQVLSMGRLVVGDNTTDGLNNNGRGEHLTVGQQAEEIKTKLVLRGDSEVVVSVRDRNGSTRNGLEVHAVPSESRLPTESIGGVELGDGQYRIAPLRAGNYRVLISDGHNPSLTQDISLASGESRRIELQSNLTGQMKGHVADVSGRPLPRVVLHAIASQNESGFFPRGLMSNDRITDGSAVSDAHGNFTIDGVAENVSYDIAAQWGPGIVAKKTNVVAGQVVTLVLDGPRRIGGIVVDESNHPANDFNVSLYNKTLGVGSAATHSGDPGHWQIDGAMPGQIVVMAQDSTGKSAELEFDLEPGRDAGELKLVLRARAVSSE